MCPCAHLYGVASLVLAGQHTLTSLWYLTCLACLLLQSIIDTMQTEQVKRAIMVLQSVLTPFAK